MPPLPIKPGPSTTFKGLTAGRPATTEPPSQPANLLPSIVIPRLPPPPSYPFPVPQSPALGNMPAVVFGSRIAPRTAEGASFKKCLDEIDNTLKGWISEEERLTRSPETTQNSMLDPIDDLAERADALHIKMIESDDFMPGDDVIAGIQGEFRALLLKRIETRMLPALGTLSEMAQASHDADLQERLADWGVRYAAAQNAGTWEHAQKLHNELPKILRDLLKTRLEEDGRPISYVEEADIAVLSQTLFSLNLVRTGLSKNVMDDFIAEWKIFRADPKLDDYDAMGVGPLPFRMTSHHLVGRERTADSFLRMVTLNMRGYRKVFGDQAEDLYHGRTRLTSEIKDPAGKGTGFYLAVERGFHEAHTGLQFAIYEGNPEGMGSKAVLAKAAVHFGEEGTLRVINLQGAPLAAVQEDVRLLQKPIREGYDENRLLIHVSGGQGNHAVLSDVVHALVQGSRALGHSSITMDDFFKHASKFRDEALQAQRKRLTKALGKAHPFNALLAGVIDWAHRNGMTKIEGISDEGQVAMQDRNRQFKPTEGRLYDSSFARFGFVPPEENSDYWSFDLTNLSIHHPGKNIVPQSLSDYFAMVLPRNIAGNQIQYESWEKGKSAPHGSEMKAFNSGIDASLGALQSTPSTRN